MTTHTESAAIPTLREALEELLAEYLSTTNSAYCQVNSDDALIEKSRAALAATPALPAPAMTDDFEGIRFRFFKDLIKDERRKVFAAFLGLPDNVLVEVRTHVDETRLLKRILKGRPVTLAATATVDRNAVLEEAAQVCEVEYTGNPNGLHLISQGFAEKVRALKSAAPASVPQPAVPQGYKLVPIEPTPEMVRAACDAMSATLAVKAAIAAAPEVEQPAVQGEALDAARWREAVRRIGYRETGTIDGPVWALDLPTPNRSGNTDENFIAAIDAARATPAEQSTDRPAEGM
jgi:hypothetical protein